MELIRAALRCPDALQKKKKKAPESQWMHCFYFCTLLKCVHGVW